MSVNKVLIVTNRTDGGIGTYLKQITTLKNTEISLVILKQTKDSFTRVKHIHIHHGNYQFEKSRLYNPLNYLRLLGEILWLRSILVKERPEILLTIDLHACLLGILACLSQFTHSDVKIIATIHNNFPLVFNEKIPKLFRPSLIFVCNSLFKRVNVFVCVSKGLAENFRQFFELRNVRVIVNGLSSETRIKGNHSKKERELFAKEHFNIVSIARFEPQKDFLTLIKAYSLFASKAKNSKLILIGKGSQEKMLKEVVNREGKSSNIHFLGWKNNVDQYLDTASIFVLSTHYEGFGYVLLEAMARGVPVISTDAPFGPSEILGKGKYGILIEPRSERKLANAMLKLYHGKELRMKFSKLGRERVKKYSQTEMVVSYERLIESVTV